MGTDRRSAGNPDPRAVRARGRLVAAFLDIAARESVSDLSVARLVREAGVDRSTFYAHFGSIGELGLEAVRPELVATLDAIRDVALHDLEASPGDLLSTFLDHLLAFRSIYSDLLTAPLTGAVCVDVVATVRAHSERTLGEISERLPEGVSPEVAAAFVVNSVLGVVGSWLSGRIQGEPEEIIAQVLALLGLSPRGSRGHTA